ncbi:MAG: family 20 glycosylhydrolase, partial [Flavobacteriaceae bacterium]|nr:family 20 glycosylhydrolase [Flavobacteriaceae bacterium]
QGDPENEPIAFGGFNTLKKVYDYEPIPAELSAEEAKYVLGSQANLWTEFVPTYEQAEYMLLPRMPALAEVLWSIKESRNWNDFNKRLKPHLIGFEQKGIRYSKGNFKVDIKPSILNNQLTVALETENTDAQIYYTTDGTTPNSGSMKYETPIVVNKSITVKAGLSLNNKILNLKPAEQSFSMNLATGKKVVYTKPFSKHYPANGENSLTDGIKGTKELGKLWHAFSGDDMTATIDLGELKTVKNISLGCIQNWGQWVFLPSSVKFEASQDGINFTELNNLKNTIPMDERAIILKDFSINFEPKQIKYVRVTAKNPGVCPPNHAGANQPSWVFVDEIVVE